MQIKLTTEDLQDLIIALVEYRPGRVITEDDIHRLLDLLSDLNRRCTPENGYTITAEIKETN